MLRPGLDERADEPESYPSQNYNPLNIGWQHRHSIGRARSAAAGLAYAEPSDKTTEQVYENIQVLKGMPYSQLIPTMQLASEMLGVDCAFCHAENRAVEGLPRKDTAREMFRMVAEMNRNYFGGQNRVTCYSCHRGSPSASAEPEWSEVFRDPSEPAEFLVAESGRQTPMNRYPPWKTFSTVTLHRWEAHRRWRRSAAAPNVEN